MKRIFFGTLVAATLAWSGAVNAQPAQSEVAQQLAGWYVGAKTGVNSTSIKGADSNEAWTVGVEAGYNWALNHRWVVGANIFYDYNASADHTPGFIDNALDTDDLRVGTHAYGIDGKLGFVAGPVMYYGKVGAARLDGRSDVDNDDEGFHGGLGVEFMFSRTWSLTGEWLYSEADLVGPDDRSLRNNNFTIGLNAHF